MASANSTINKANLSKQLIRLGMSYVEAAEGQHLIQAKANRAGPSAPKGAVQTVMMGRVCLDLTHLWRTKRTHR